MYSRSDTHWLYLYYSGENISYIAETIGRSKGAVTSRIKYMKLPMRPRGGADVGEWVEQRHVKALRRLFKPR